MSVIKSWFATLDWGNVPDWLGAVGTIAAVFVAVYLPYKSTRPRGKAKLTSLYYVPQVELSGYDVSFYNTGATAINVSSLSIGVAGSTKRLLLSTDFSGGVIQPGEGYSSGGSAIDTYEALLRNYGLKNQIKIYPKVTDSIGNIYKGKKITVNLNLLKNELAYQSQLYGSNPQAVESDNKTLFNTKKID